MKALYYIFGIALLTLASCSSGLYVGTEYDDLYYQDSDQPVTRVASGVNRQIVEGDLKSEAYYDNIYASDTLVSREYADAVDYDDTPAVNYNNNYYYDNYSYAGRLSRFYGNYFNPYWRDPYYYSWYPSFNFYYGGYPYYYGYDPFYYDYYYSPFYSPYYYGYGGYYGSFLYGGLFNSYYPFYGGYYPYYGRYYSYGYDDWNGVTYGRRERPSTLSTRWAGGGVSSPVGSSSRRSTDLASGTDPSSRSVTSTQTISPESRRSNLPVTATQREVTSAQRSATQPVSKSTTVDGSAAQNRRTQVETRPEYNSVNRTYTPSYSSPRMSTRPSYNNTRVNSNVNQYNNSRTNINNTNRPIIIQRSNQSSSGTQRSRSSYSPAQSRSGSTYSSPGSYSVPSRRSSGSSLSGSNGSGSRSSFGSSSSGSFSRGSYSSGSSSSVSSSSGSSSRSSSSSSSSGSRRR